MKNNKKGFTLIELLVVIAIIGLLSTLAVVSLNSARVKARDARRMSDLKQISTAMELYASDSNIGSYPHSQAAGVCAIDTPGRVGPVAVAAAREILCSGAGMAVCADNDDDLGTGAPDGDCGDAADVTYLTAIPEDPVNATSGAVDYYYEYEGTASTYCLQATLETGSPAAYFVCVSGSCFGSASVCNPI